MVILRKLLKVIKVVKSASYYFTDINYHSDGMTFCREMWGQENGFNFKKRTKSVRT